MKPESPPDEYAKIFDSRGHLYNEAGSRSPRARGAERAALIGRLDVAEGQVVCDLPAGGGYLADGVHALWGDRVKVICVEPARRFAAAVAPHFELRHDPLHLLSLGDASVDRMASLAGLHHVEDRLDCYREWWRVLKPGGKLVVADVEAGTGTADFLNVFVHQHTPGGHVGKFFHPGELERELAEAGFSHVREELVAVPWEYSGVREMQDFCKTLFALECATPEDVLQGISVHLGWGRSGDGVRMNWSLRYAEAVKPG